MSALDGGNVANTVNIAVHQKPHRKAQELEFYSLNYAVPTLQGDKYILRNVSGKAIPGRLLTIMGRSGSGKSTLLDVLGFRHSKERLEGDVLENGLPCKFQHSSHCYVTQHEVLLSTSTVREALLTSAQLRLPYGMPDKVKASLVQSIIEELGLQRCADTIIGEGVQGGKGISGGERRRTSIGLELITDPTLILLDEPTSGLDSDTAMSIIVAMQQLARRNRTVVCTLHQPSGEMLQLFDDLLLLTDGRVAYHGPFNLAVKFIRQAGFMCPPYTSPTDFFMTLFKDESTGAAICDAWDRYILEAGSITYTADDRDDRCDSKASLLASRPATPPSPAPVKKHSLKPCSNDELLEGGLLGTTRPTQHKSRLVHDNPIFTDEGDSGRQDAPPSDCSKQVLRPWSSDGVLTRREPLDQKQATKRKTQPILPIHGNAPHMGALDVEQPDSGIWQRPPMWYQTVVLAKRFVRTHYRNPALMVSEISQYLFLAVNLGLMYFSLTDRLDRNAIHMRASALWFTLATLALAPPGVAATAWNLERAVLRHEQAVNAYHPAAFYIAKTLTTWPIEVIQTAAFCGVVYFMVGYQASASAFFVFMVTAVLCQLISETLGVLCATLTTNSMYAIMVATIILIYMLAFNGFLLPETPVYFIWLKKISYLDFAYTVLVANEFTGLQLKDKDGSIVHGQDVIPNFAQNGLSTTANLITIACILMGARIIGYVQLLCALRWKWL